MSPLQTLRVALRALLRNKLRSSLTTLGIVIGVGAVIAMVAIGEGAKAMVEEAFSAMGSNLLIVLPGSSSRGGAMGGAGSMPTVTWDDLAAIRSEVPSVRYAAATLRANVQVVSEEQNWGTTVYGTSPEYLALRSWDVELGNNFTQSDVDGGTKVVVLGRTVVNKLYGADSDPVGQSVRISNVPFTVVGVLAAKGQSPMGQDYDDAMLIPQSTFQAKIQGGLQKFVSGALLVGARPEDGTARASRQITALLRDRHRLQPGTDDDFSIRNLAEMAAAQQQGTETLTTLLASVAAVSLLVGGIGIMNIMLVSVTERTKEIGLRMAVGAKPRNVMAQFLVESLALSIAGGVIGIGLGLFTASRMASQFGWPMLVRPEIIAVAVGFSGLVGVGFGLYPARKASLLDPIDALRYE
jgi:putative ABC transport system permease protein